MLQPQLLPASHLRSQQTRMDQCGVRLQRVEVEAEAVVAVGIGEEAGVEEGAGEKRGAAA